MEICLLKFLFLEVIFKLLGLNNRFILVASLDFVEKTKACQ